MFQREVEGVIGTEAATGGCDLLRAAQIFHQGRDFMDDVAFVGVVAHDAIMRMNPAVVPAFRIHAIHAKDLQVAGVDFPGEFVDHAVVFKFEKAPLRGGKNQDGVASVAIGQQFHISAQAGGVPIVIIASHSGDSIFADAALSEMFIRPRHNQVTAGGKKVRRILFVSIRLADKNATHCHLLEQPGSRTGSFRRIFRRCRSL